MSDDNSAEPKEDTKSEEVPRVSPGSPPTLDYQLPGKVSQPLHFSVGSIVLGGITLILEELLWNGTFANTPIWVALTATAMIPIIAFAGIVKGIRGLSMKMCAWPLRVSGFTISLFGFGTFVGMVIYFFMHFPKC